jgi:hypothetical protein
MPENQAVDLGGPWPAPPTQGVTQFAVAVNLNEVMLTFGVSRASMQPDAAGVPTPVLGPEWLVSLSIPPTLAKLLQSNLVVLLEKYEQLFGKIPADPAAKVTISDGIRPG